MFGRRVEGHLQILHRHPPNLYSACVLLLTLFPPLLLAQAPPPSPPRLEGHPVFQIMGGEDDLPQLNVEAMARDTHGYLWVATQEGAARYDGRTWVHFDVEAPGASNYVTDILPARDGSHWFATDFGLAHWRDERWTSLSPRQAGLQADAVLSLAESDEGIWVGTEAGLALMRDGTWHTAPAGQGRSPNLPDVGNVRVLWVTGSAASEQLWAGTDRGLWRRRDGQWQQTQIPEATALRTASIWAIAGDGIDMWVASEYQVAHRDRSGQWSVVDLPGLEGARIQSMEVTGLLEQQTLWVGTSQGLARVLGKRVSVFGQDNGLISSSVSELLATVDGDHVLLWIGQTSGGVSRAVLGGWSVIDVQSSGLPNNDVYVLLESGPVERPAYWFGTEMGLARWYEGQWRVFDTSNSGLPHNFVNALLETDDGTVWVGTDGGLVEMAGGRPPLLPSTAPLPTPRVISLLEGADGHLWIGTAGGLLQRRPDGSWVHHEAGPAGLPGPQVYSLAETWHDGRRSLWAGTRRGGLGLLRAGRWQRVGGTPGSDTETALPSPWVNGLLAHRADSRYPPSRSEEATSLWAGTDGGAVRIDPRAPQPTAQAPWLVFNRDSQPALPANVVYQIQADSQGYLFFFTNRGVGRWKGGPSPTMQHLSRADGVPGREFNQWASMVDRRGRVLAGSTRGVAIFDPRQASSTWPFHPELRLHRIEVDGRSNTRLVRSLVADGEPLQLSHDSALTIGWAMPSLYRGTDLLFQRQLLGLDRQPSAWTDATEQTFARMPAGRYTFRVWARDHEGLVHGPAQLELAVRPAPWRTAWAWLLYAIASVFAGRWLLRLRERTLRRRQQELERAVTERTESLARSEAAARAAEAEAAEANRVKGQFLANMSHELRTPLNAIIGLTGLLTQGDLQERELQWLETVRRNGELLLALVSEILDFEKLEMGRLPLAELPFGLASMVGGALDSLRPEAEHKGLDLFLDLDPSLPARIVADPVRLQQVVANLVNNAIKFTDRGEVRVTMWAEPAARFQDHGSIGEVLTPTDPPSPRPPAQQPFRLCCTVRDTGIGIPEDRLHLLFEPFTQVDDSTSRMYGGSGLGLAICKGLVEQMGGTISVDSQPGEGSEFSFSVRVARQPDGLDEVSDSAISLATGASPALPGGKVPDRQGGDRRAENGSDYSNDALSGPSLPARHRDQGRGLRVLIIEDNSVSALLAEEMLKHLGSEVLQVDDLAAAKPYLETTSLAELPIHAVWFDLEHPGGLSRQIAVSLRGWVARGQLPLLIGSGPAGGAPDEVDLVLAKPLQIHRLSSALRRLHRHGNPSGSAPA